MDESEGSALRGFTEEALFGDSDQLEACLEWWASESEGEEVKRIPEGQNRAKRLTSAETSNFDDLVDQYFCGNPIYDERDFRRHFRMSKMLFLRIFNAVVENDPYFEHRSDATGKLGIYPLVKVVAALRVLANALPADAIDENFGMAESTVCESILVVLLLHFRHFDRPHSNSQMTKVSARIELYSVSNPF